MGDIQIVRGTAEHYEDCKTALLASEIGRVYFNEDERVHKLFYDGIEKGELYVALKNEQALGYIRFSRNGAFSSFPYLRNIAVSEAFRGQGIGTALLQFFEQECRTYTDKVFLLVSHFNSPAIRLYRRLGYEQVGEIPSLVIEGVSEYLMMKSLK